jgi:hypothetical protein
MAHHSPATAPRPCLHSRTTTRLASRPPAPASHRRGPHDFSVFLRQALRYGGDAATLGVKRHAGHRGSESGEERLLGPPRPFAFFSCPYLDASRPLAPALVIRQPSKSSEIPPFPGAKGGSPDLLGARSMRPRRRDRELPGPSISEWRGPWQTGNRSTRATKKPRSYPRPLVFHVMVELNGIEHARPGALRAPSASLRGVGLFQLK